jgi:hypothetical protein
MPPRKGSKPPAPNLSPTIPVEVSQALQSVHSRVTDLTAQVGQQQTDIKGKLSSSLKDMLSVSAFVNTQLRSTGANPLSITALQGQASQPQLAKVPGYSVLPGNAQPGQIVQMNNQLYVFGTSGATGTLGVWGSVGGSGTLVDTHANRLAIYPAAKYQLGTLFYETDRTVLYVNSSSVWTFAAGLNENVFASRPTGLGVADASFLFLATDTSTLYAWTGTAWLTIGGGTDPNGPALIFNQTPRDYTADIEEIRRQIATLDTPFNLGVLTGLFDPAGAAATAQAAAQGIAQILVDPGRDWSLQIEELRRVVAALDPPLSASAVALLNAPNVFTALNTFTAAAKFSASSTGTPNITSDGTTGILNICPGTTLTDPRIFLGGSASVGAPGFAVTDADTILLRSSDGTVLVLQATKAAGINGLGPLNTVVTGSFGGWVTGPGGGGWSPTVSGPGLTVSSYTVLATQYLHMGPLIFFTMLVSLTVTGTGNQLIFTLPTGLPCVGGQSPCTCYIGPGGASYAASYALVSPSGPAGIVASPSAGANYTSGTFYGIFVEAFYRSF